MAQINSLERAFTVLTYLLAPQQFNYTGNQKPTCDHFEGDLNKVENAIVSMTDFVDSLQSISNTLVDIQIDLQNEPEPTVTKPYKCVDKSLRNLFCEDNRYSKNLVLIGRVHSPMSHDLYQKLLNGIPCDEKCIDSDTDFFIGINNFMQLIHNQSLELLFIYTDTDDMEHFHYIPAYQFDGIKLNIERVRSSMSDVSLKELKNIENLKFKNFKIFLLKKLRNI